MLNAKYIGSLCSNCFTIQLTSINDHILSSTVITFSDTKSAFLHFADKLFFFFVFLLLSNLKNSGLLVVIEYIKAMLFFNLMDHKTSSIYAFMVLLTML